jgi:hypothetical protein
MADAPDTFTRDLFAWLNQVKADADLPASAFKVAFELGQHANRKRFGETGHLTAWPSLETIAAGIGMSPRTARGMARRLAEAGHVEVKTGHGPGHPSTYTLCKNRQPAAALNRQGTAAFDEAKPAGCDTKTGRELPHKTGSRLPTNHLSKPSEEPSESLPAGEGARAKKGQQDRQRRIDPSWQPSQRDCEYGIEKGIDPSAIDAVAEKFVDHHQAKGSTFADWSAAWRNWCRNEVKFAAERASRQQSGSRSLSVHGAAYLRDLADDIEEF